MTLKQYKQILDPWERVLDYASVLLNHQVIVDTITTRFLLLFLFLLSIPLMTVILFTVNTMSQQLNSNANQQMALTRNLYDNGINRLLEANQLPSRNELLYEIKDSYLQLVPPQETHEQKAAFPLAHSKLVIDNAFLNQRYQRYPTIESEIWILSIPVPGEMPHLLARTTKKNAFIIPMKDLIDKLNQDIPVDETVTVTLQGLNYQLEQIYLFNSDHEKIARLLFILPLMKHNRLLNDFYLGIYIIAVSSLIFSVLLAMLAGRTITQPLLKLIRQVDTTSRESFLKNKASFKIDGVSEIRQLAEAFNRLVSRLKQEQTMRDEFVATLTHDLKVPMLAEKQTLAYFQKESYGPISEEQGEVLDILRSSNLSCLALVNGLLEVYRYDSGSARLMPENFDLAHLLCKTVTELNPLDQEKGVTLKLDLGVIEYATVFADSMEIKRVLHNLISNAITNTSRYGDITCRLSDAAANGRRAITKVSDFQHSTLQQAVRTQDRLLVSVNDTGVGFTQEDLPHLFKQFAASRGRNPMSIGLGLYNCHQVINAHNSMLWVESSEGEGSAVNFLLPTNANTFQERRIRHDRRHNAD